jgi:hypothetical protein
MVVRLPSIPSFPKLNSLRLRNFFAKSLVESGDVPNATKLLDQHGVKYEIALADPNVPGSKNRILVGPNKLELNDVALQDMGKFYRDAGVVGDDLANALKIMDTNLPDPKVKQSLFARSKQAKPQVEAEVNKTGTSATAKKTQWAKIIALTMPALVSAGLSVYAVYLAKQRLDDKAEFESGCWLFNKETGQKVRKVSNSTDNVHCQCGKNQITSGLEASVAQACYDECFALDPAPPNGTGAGPFWEQCTTQCACAVAGTSPIQLQPDEFNLQISSELWDPIDAGLDVLADFGLAVTGMIDGALEFASNAASSAMEGVQKLLMYGGIALGSAVVLAIIGVVVWQVTKKKKQAASSTTMKGGSESGTCDLWGGRSVFFT